MTNTDNNAITKYTISPVNKNANGVVALASVTFYDTITVNSITIRKGDDGNLYVRMPNKKTNQGNYIDVAHPLNAKTRQELNNTLINAYKSGEYKKEFSFNNEPKITAQNAHKFNGDKSNCLARLDVVIEDMVVHNCRIFGGENGKNSIVMPAYCDNAGEYHSIVTPTSPNGFSKIKDAAMAEYNTEYSYRTLSENDIAKVKEADINVVVRKNDKGKNIVKFKSNDLEKVNQAIAQNRAIKK